MKINKTYMLLCLVSSHIISFSDTAMAAAAVEVDNDAFKVKFATHAVRVRDSANRNVDSTWEQIVPNQGLAERAAREATDEQVQGMCCSHAVVCGLEYCHDRADLLASYVHKAVTGSYEKGMALDAAMNFVRDNGVMALPADQEVKPGSGLSWPGGPRYKFSRVVNADPRSGSRMLEAEPSWLDHTKAYRGEAAPWYGTPGIDFQTLDKAGRYRHILQYYNHPIVVSILSGYKGHRDKSPFLKYRGRDLDSVAAAVQEDPSVPADAQRSYHAVVLYGFRESKKYFFVKNSWGPDGINGLCTLPFEYINKFANCAFVGMGHDNWEGAGLRQGMLHRDLVEHHREAAIEVRDDVPIPHNSAQFQLAVRDYGVPGAIRWFKERANHLNDKGAYYYIGNLYRHGQEGIGIDLEEAKRWYKKAADMGHDSAQEAWNQLSSGCILL